MSQKVPVLVHQALALSNQLPDGKVLIEKAFPMLL